MQFIPVPGSASFELIYDVLGQKFENVVYANTITTWTEAELAAKCGAILDWANAYWKVNTPSGVVLSKIVAKDLSSKDGPAIEFTTGLPLAGTYAAGVLEPLNVTAAVSFGTAKRGRSYRGRIYVVGIAKSGTAGNQLTGETQGSILSTYSALIAAMNTAGGTAVVVSRYANKAPRTSGVSTNITSVSVDINLDSQRRRLNGRGQ